LHHREFETERPLTEAVAAYTKEVGRGLTKPLDRDAPDPTLLVLDGLDELSRAGRVGLEQMRAFMGAVGVLLEGWNTDPKAARLMVLVCGRPIAADVARAAVRKPEAVLHLLPFVVDKQEINKPPAGRQLTLGGQTALLDTDQREAWWRQYADAKERVVWAGVYAEIKANEALTAVTSQPLLNYLVAFLLDNTPGRTLPAGRFDLYRRLTHAVWERRWGVNRVPTAGPLEFEHFLELLEEVAIAAWHGGNIREIRVAAVKARLTPEQRTRLTAVEAEEDQGLLRLMLAFFTRPRGGVKGDEAYEFTHKSFAEFLVASRVASHLDALAEQYARPDTRPERRDEDALIDWAKLFGPVVLDLDLQAFVRDAATIRGKERVGAWGSVVARLLGVVVRSGMPMHKMTTDIKPEPTFRAMNDWALRAEFAMLDIMAACATVTRERWKVDGLPSTLGSWVGGRWAEWGRQGVFNWLDLTRTDLQRVMLTSIVMSKVSLSHADLGEAFLNEANLRDADLTGTNLTAVNLMGGYLHTTSLRGANLTRAVFFGAILDKADLTGANLTSAILDRVYLTDANLTGADLTGANLTAAYLTGANLTGANLTGANITSARLDSVVGVTVADLARLTLGDPATLPDGTKPAPNWRAMALAPKRSPRRRKGAAPPESPGPEGAGSAHPPASP
ncbi:MAG TPA: pentapeptide repeat-containing protein, partial [Urbifossiella sp.]|nr:pentapeptide repeat-containing protein [Urbifossiella sp.]